MPGAAPGGAVAPTGRFSVGDAFNYGWKKFQQNIGPWLLGCLIALAAMAILYFIMIAVMVPIVASNATVVETRNGVEVISTGGGGAGALIVSIIFGVLIALLGWIISAQFIRAALGVTDQGKIDLGIFFKKEFLGPVIVASIILAIIQLVLGLIGIIPIIGWLIQFIGSIVVAFFAQFYAYFVLDQQQAPVDSIKSSFSFVNKHLANIIVLFLASLLALFIGAILCGIGLFVAIPVTVMAHAYTYRFLNNEPIAA